ncbi:dephospho-CoA kinase [bacterium]|nr:dephospho-CoA kinase [bacterium]
MLVVGVTGSIGTGKSTVCKIFKELGAYLINADIMGHDILRRKSIKEKLINLFSDAILDADKNVDRDKLAAIVFDNKKELKKLDDTVHPQLVKEIKMALNNLKDTNYPGIVVIDAALIYKWDVFNWLDYLIVVDAPIWHRAKRLVKTRGYTDDQAQKRINVTSLDIKKLNPHIDFIIRNNGTLNELRPKVVKVWIELKSEQEIRLNN